LELQNRFRDRFISIKEIDVIRVLSGSAASTNAIGFLNGGSPEPFADYVAAFRQGLGETGFAEGRKLAIEFRWAEGQNDRLPAQSADLGVEPQQVVLGQTEAADGCFGF
jgi:hypothetical protein